MTSLERDQRRKGKAFLLCFVHKGKFYILHWPYNLCGWPWLKVSKGNGKDYRRRAVVEEWLERRDTRLTLREDGLIKWHNRGWWTLHFEQWPRMRLWETWKLPCQRSKWSLAKVLVWVHRRTPMLNFIADGLSSG